MARRSSLLVGSEISAKRRSTTSHEGLREKSVEDKHANEQQHRDAQEGAEIGNVIPAVGDRAHESVAIGAQHVNGGNHHAPQRKHGCDLEDVKALHLPTVLE